MSPFLLPGMKPQKPSAKTSSFGVGFFLSPPSNRERKFCVVEANVRQAINRARAIALFFMNENSFFSWFYACGLMFVVVSAARVRLINCVVGRVRRGTEEDIAVSTNLLAARVFCWFFGGRKVSAFLFASAAIRILPMSLRLVEKVNNKQ